VIAKLNTSYLFPSVAEPNSIVSLWLLDRQTPTSFTQNKTNSNRYPLYDSRLLPRNTSISSRYPCLPSEQSCYQINIGSVSLEDLGVYSFRYDSSDYASTTTVKFNMTAYVDTIKFACTNNASSSSNASCGYNSDTQTLSVVANTNVQLTCSILVAQNDLYPIGAQFMFRSEAGDECLDVQTVTNVLDTSLAQSLIANWSSSMQRFNAIVASMSKSCAKRFVKGDVSKSFSCLFNPVDTSQQVGSFESVNVKLDVQYGPELINGNGFNRTAAVNDQKNITFSCPFSGNPAPSFFWRVATVWFNNSDAKLVTLTPGGWSAASSSAQFTVQSNLQVGYYSFECRAFVAGLVNSYSPNVTFYLEMMAPLPLVSNSGVNLGALIGGIVGGVFLIIILVILIVVMLKIHRNRQNPKDEIEKAKE